MLITVRLPISNILHTRCDYSFGITGDIFYTPRAHAATRFKNIVTWNTYESGGHFAAWEEADVLVADIRAFVEAVQQLAT